jgi:tyrosinase
MTFSQRLRPPKLGLLLEINPTLGQVLSDRHPWTCPTPSCARYPRGTLARQRPRATEVATALSTMSPTGAPSPSQPAVPLEHRPSVDQLSAGQLTLLRQAITAAQAISDERGYQYWAGVHGLPLPMYCQHGTPLFLPWHRAYLYLFEKALQDLVPGTMLAWWDWTVAHDIGIPAAYTEKEVAAAPNALYSSAIQVSGREPGGSDHTVRQPGLPEAPPLPDPDRLQQILGLGDFIDFQTQLEDVHNGIHVWVGGTMSDIATAAYDPLFWAHHTMIDRVWRLWQVAHPAASPPGSLLSQALPPFPMTVSQTLDVSSLGYDYAASAASASGPAGQ